MVQNLTSKMTKLFCKAKSECVRLEPRTPLLALSIIAHFFISFYFIFNPCARYRDGRHDWH